MVGLAAEVTVEIAPRRFGLQQPAIAKGLAGEKVAGEPGQRPAKPLPERNRETLLGLVQHFGRQPAGRRAAEQMLAAPAADAQRTRQSDRELDQAMVRNGARPSSEFAIAMRSSFTRMSSGR